MVVSWCFRGSWFVLRRNVQEVVGRKRWTIFRRHTFYPHAPQRSPARAGLEVGVQNENRLPRGRIGPNSRTDAICRAHAMVLRPLKDLFSHAKSSTQQAALESVRIVVARRREKNTRRAASNLGFSSGAILPHLFPSIHHHRAIEPAS